jgi:hypothetical protein
MLVLLQRWAREHNIRFLLFHPSKSVQNKLKRSRSIAEFYNIASSLIESVLLLRFPDFHDK